MYDRCVENVSAAEAECSRWFRDDRAHEVVLRRVAARQGVRLERSRRRSSVPTAAMMSLLRVPFGPWQLIRANSRRDV